MDNFASIIRQRRDELALNQEQVAQRSGVSVSAYTKYENGRNEPTWGKALAILSALGLEVQLGGATIQTDTSNQPLPHGVRANVYVGDKCILSGILAPTDTPLEITAQVQVGEPEKVAAGD